jgi:hypothetical protein
MSGLAHLDGPCRYKPHMQCHNFINASCFLTTTISDFLTMSYNPSPSPPHSLTPVNDDFGNRMMRMRLAEIVADFSPPPTPSVPNPPALTGRQTVAFNSQPPEFSNPGSGFQGGSLPHTHSPPRVSLGENTPTVNPCDIPLGVMPVGKQSLSGNVELSIFNILNIFHR